MAVLPHFTCSGCGKRVGAAGCACGWPALVEREFVPSDFPRTTLAGRASSMWRYAEALTDAPPVTLGEGFTPLLRDGKFPGLLIKEEGRNPTGSAYARSASVLVSAARQSGIGSMVVAGVSGDLSRALAAYCAAASIALELILPPGSSPLLRAECELYGATVRVTANPVTSSPEFLDLQPFALEGIKTIGYELAEQLEWQLPASLIWPGNGHDLLAFFKAFGEMETLQWIDSRRPRIIVPGNRSEKWSEALMRVVKHSGGLVVAVSAAEIAEARQAWAREGILSSLEGATSLAVYRSLLNRDAFKEGDTVVAINTAAGHTELGSSWMGRPKSRSIGGIIQPY